MPVKLEIDARAGTKMAMISCAVRPIVTINEESSTVGGENNFSLKRSSIGKAIWRFPKMLGFPNNHAVFLPKKTIVLGCEMGGTTI